MTDVSQVLAQLRAEIGVRDVDKGARPLRQRGPVQPRHTIFRTLAQRDLLGPRLGALDGRASPDELLQGMAKAGAPRALVDRIGSVLWTLAGRGLVVGA